MSHLFPNSRRQIVAAALVVFGLALPLTPTMDAAETETWQQVAPKWTCPEWFKDAKFGLWLHWGPQTVPEKGGGWYARHLYKEDCSNEPWGKEAWSYHRETYGHQSKVGYKDICRLWKAEHFDADATVTRFKDWGARFVAILANHHDNFDSFPSEVHGWNSTKVGPMRDLVGEFAAAARKHGLKWGASVHCARAPGWYRPAFGADSSGPLKGVPYDGNLTKADGVGTWWDGLDPQQLYAGKYKPFAKEAGERVMTLVRNYQPDELYFDDHGEIFPSFEPACAALLTESAQRNGSIQALITMKTDLKTGHLPVGTVNDIEKGGAEKLEDDWWQTDTTLAGDWFLKPAADGSSRMRHDVRSLVEMLVDIVSKRGVLLLNVAARADGTIPDDQAQVLDALGTWLRANGEAIYGTRPWRIYGEGGMMKGGRGNERGIDSKPWGADVQRFTVNQAGTVLYVHIFGAAANRKVVVNALAAARGLFTGTVQAVSVLGCSDRPTWSSEPDGLHVTLPNKPGFADCNVLKIEASGL
jgi:alpha-L-fucosidase